MRVIARQKSAALGSLPSLMTVAFPLLFPQSVRSTVRRTHGVRHEITSYFPAAPIPNPCRQTFQVGQPSAPPHTWMRTSPEPALHKTSVFRETSFHQRLRLVYKRIRQRI